MCQKNSKTVLLPVLVVVQVRQDVERREYGERTTEQYSVMPVRRTNNTCRNRTSPFSLPREQINIHFLHTRSVYKYIRSKLIDRGGLGCHGTTLS
jgi:hypothetical protein